MFADPAQSANVGGPAGPAQAGGGVEVWPAAERRGRFAPSRGVPKDKTTRVGSEPVYEPTRPDPPVPDDSGSRGYRIGPWPPMPAEPEPGTEATARLSRRHQAPDTDSTARLSRRHQLPEPEQGAEAPPAPERPRRRHGRDDTTQTPVLGQMPAAFGEPGAVPQWSTPPGPGQPQQQWSAPRPPDQQWSAPPGQAAPSAPGLAPSEDLPGPGTWPGQAAPNEGLPGQGTRSRQGAPSDQRWPAPGAPAHETVSFPAAPSYPAPVEEPTGPATVPARPAGSVPPVQPGPDGSWGAPAPAEPDGSWGAPAPAEPAGSWGAPASSGPDGWLAPAEPSGRWGAQPLPPADPASPADFASPAEPAPAWSAPAEPMPRRARHAHPDADAGSGDSAAALGFEPTARHEPAGPGGSEPAARLGPLPPRLAPPSPQVASDWSALPTSSGPYPAPSTDPAPGGAGLDAPEPPGAPHRAAGYEPAAQPQAAPHIPAVPDGSFAPAAGGPSGFAGAPSVPADPPGDPAPADDATGPQWPVPPRVQSAIDAVRSARPGRHGAERPAAPAEQTAPGEPAEPAHRADWTAPGAQAERVHRAEPGQHTWSDRGATGAPAEPAGWSAGTDAGGQPGDAVADWTFDAPTTETPVLPGPNRVDAESVLAAVRDVPGVRGADLRTDPAGSRTLRLEVADGADADQIRAAAGHALRDRLGVEARLTVADVGDELDTAHDDRTELDRSTGADAAVAVADAERSAEPRAVIERIQVATAGSECAVEVCLTADGARAVGRAGGPALDPYLLRVAALATADAVGVLVGGRARCAVEHVDVVTAGPCRVVVVVLVLLAGDSAERLVGSAVVVGDPRQATVRATMAALNRRLAPVLATVLA